MTTREFGRLKQAVEEATGLEITHYYDDLVFVDLGVFLLRFDNAIPGKVHLHFHQDCEASARTPLRNDLSHRSDAQGLTLAPADDFVIEDTGTEGELQIRFVPQP